MKLLRIDSSARKNSVSRLLTANFVDFWRNDLNGWSTPILIGYISLLVLGALYGVWKYRRGNRKRP